MSNQCQYQEDVARLLFEDVSQERRRELETHLDSCSVCRRELERTRRTVEQLEEWEDLPVPHHFEIAEDVDRRGPAVAFSLLSPMWKGAVAASLLTLIGLAVAFFSGIQVSARPGSLTLAWKAEPAPTLQEIMASEPFQQQLAKLLDARLSEQNRLLMTQLRGELETARDAWNLERKRDLRASVDRLENRLESRFEPRVQSLEKDVQQANLAVGTLSLQQDHAFKLLSDRIDLVAVSGEIQGSQNDLLLTTLIDMADRQLASRGGS